MIGRSFFLLSLMMAGFLNAHGDTPTPIVITSPLFPGATAVSGTAQPPDTAHSVQIYICIAANQSNTPDCSSSVAQRVKLLPTTIPGSAYVTPASGGKFTATLAVPLAPGQFVYASQVIAAGGDVVTTQSNLLAVQSAPECIPNALSGYTTPGSGRNVCTIHLDRNNLATPPPITVPKGTVVLIQLDNAHWNETIQFNRTTTTIADQDVAAAVLKQLLLQNLQALAASVRSGNVRIAAASPDPIDDAENSIQTDLENAATTITNAANELTCFEGYKAVIKTGSNIAQCGSTILVGPTDGTSTQDTFSAAKANLLSDLQSAITVGLPFTKICNIPNLVATRQQLCNPGVTVAPPGPASGCSPAPAPAPGSVTLTPLSLTQTYTGSPIAASATTNPTGQPVTFNYTGAGGTRYGPTPIPPSNVGSYTVSASMNGPPAASTTGILTISPALSSNLCSASAFDGYKVRLDGFNSTVTALEKVQQTLLGDIDILNNWSGVVDAAGKPTTTIASQFTQSRHRTSTITIAATEVVSGATSNLGTLTINWQTQPFVLSSGIMLSMLPYRSFAISQLIVNGAPVPDPTNPGKYLTYINQTVTHPSISFPMVFGNYRFGSLSRFRWEDKCPNHCAFLATAGMGYNIVQKTADFAGGLSFQIGSVLLTPAAHIGRETLLTNGLYPNEILGSNPPSALLTQNAWTVHFGLALTITIPIP